MKQILIFTLIFFTSLNVLGVEEKKAKDISNHLEKIEKRKELNELMRKKHLDLVNKLYDLKATQIGELEVLAKSAEGKSPEEQKNILAEIKKKRSEFKSSIRDYHRKTMKSELKAYRKELYGDREDKND